MSIKAIIFDLDGVIVTTDDCHYRAWKSMADDEGIYFDRKINDRLRGVSRMASLDIVLERANREYSDSEKAALAQKKNDLYVELIKQLTNEMKAAAKILEFEHAAYLRDRIEKLRRGK